MPDSQSLSSADSMEPDLPTQTRSAAVVMNGAAGALLDQAGIAETLTEAFRAAGIVPRFIDPDSGTLPERMKAACALGANLVVVAGGDGTIACAAQIASKAGVTLGILPFGTMNLLAKDLGIPAGDIEAAIRVLADGQVRRIDAGEVNGHIFLCGSVLGLPARLARYREAGRGAGSRVHVWSRFARAALRGIARYRPLRLAVRIDGEAVRLRASAITIVPNKLDDADGRLFGRSRLDGGELRLYAIGHTRLPDILRLALSVLFGRWRTDRDLSEFGGRAIDVITRKKAVRVTNDGEIMLLTPPLEYRIRPGVLAVLAPASATDAN